MGYLCDSMSRSACEGIFIGGPVHMHAVFWTARILELKEYFDKYLFQWFQEQPVQNFWRLQDHKTYKTKIL